MNVVKGVAIGMAAGMAVGYVGKKAADDNPKLRKKANRAYKTFENIVDTAQYMFKKKNGDRAENPPCLSAFTITKRSPEGLPVYRPL